MKYKNLKEEDIEKNGFEYYNMNLIKKYTKVSENLLKKYSKQLEAQASDE